MASLTLACRSALSVTHPRVSSLPGLHACAPSQIPDMRQRTDSSTPPTPAASAAFPLCTCRASQVLSLTCDSCIIMQKCLGVRVAGCECPQE